MDEFEETVEEARQGETSRRHNIFKVLVVSTTLAAVLLFVVLIFFTVFR